MEKDLQTREFFWGGAITSWQTEGSYNKYGKGLSIIDIRERKENHTDFNDGIDFYHKYKDDIKLFKELGINSFRFSVSWSRIMPDGETTINQEGIDFYNNLIDELVENNIEPIITIYHFDLPLALAKKYNGFYSRKVVDLYEEYAKILYENFGDRVKHWITFNEINTVRMRDIHYGAQKPNDLSDKEFSCILIHNVMISHARATKALHKMVPGAYMSGMVTYIPMYPATCKPEDILEANRLNQIMNEMYLNIFVKGEYPFYYFNWLKKNNIEPPFCKGDMELLKENTVDYISISYYRTETVSASTGGKENKIGFRQLVNNPYLVETEWGWAMDSMGLKTALINIYERYGLPIFIVENGIGIRESLDSNMTVNDDYRILYMKEHIAQMKSAMAEGVKVIGYLAWGPIDLISSQGEMKKRYGFVYVNREENNLLDLKRYKKKSFSWFQKVISSDGDEL